MKNSLFIAIITLFSLTVNANIGLEYYMPNNVEFDAKIPTPSTVLGYEVGEWMVSHDQLVSYLKTIANSTDRAVLKEYARSHENRPLYHLIFSSPKNIERLEEIRTEHLKLSDPNISSDINVEKMPLVMILGYSVHGNEASAVNASLLTIYFLAAAKGEEIDKLLENTVIIVDPALNPDGVNRFASWANMHKSKSGAIDPNSRVFKEVWPGGRTNHYWFDLNRDYILLAHPESRGRVEQIQRWKPNIVTDHHEMGSNNTFFFQPGVPSRINPLTPHKNHLLTAKIAEYHAKYLDKIGSRYFTEEVFDDYYYGKGSSYPDVNSGVGILFEQASIRGFQRETDNGIITFPFAIKNQFTVTLSTLEAAKNMRVELLDYQKEFYTNAFKEADKDDVKAYLFGGVSDQGRILELLKILRNHHIDVYQLLDDVKVGDKFFAKESSYMIPLKQQNYRLIKSLFEINRYFKDQTFYDVSTWNMAMSFNLPLAEIKDKKQIDKLKGNALTELQLHGDLINSSDNTVAWAFQWDEYYAPRALSEILSLGLQAKVAQSPFTYRDENLNKEFSYGTILIPAHDQSLSQEEIHQKMKMISKRDGLTIYSLKTSLTPSGIDLGSSTFSPLKQKQVLMLVEGKTNSRDAGEIWHLFDIRYSQPITLLEVDRINSVDINNYNVMILPGGSYNELSKTVVEKISAWLKNGGSLIAYKNASKWASKAFNLDIKFKKSVNNLAQKPVYGQMSADANRQAISGAIFETEMDLTHPLTFGYTQKTLAVFKSGTMLAENSKNPYASPIRYSNDPLLSGYCSDLNHERIKGAPFVMINALGRGRIISIFDNTNFRGVWYGSNKVFTNAVYFGHLIKSGPRRSDEE